MDRRAIRLSLPVHLTHWSEVLAWILLKMRSHIPGDGPTSAASAALCCHPTYSSFAAQASCSGAEYAGFMKRRVEAPSAIAIAAGQYPGFIIEIDGTCEDLDKVIACLPWETREV